MLSKQTVTYQANAKINLSLDILGVLDNGYHQLEMIMQSVSLHDVVTISRQTNELSSITVTCSTSSLCPMEQNTAYKAAIAFFTYCNVKADKITIHIEKHIPSQAGLAGGSADAAAVLHGLNVLYKTELTLKQLCEIGVQIGADVPFCICGGTMLAQGIGDVLSPLAPMPNCHMVICKPPVSISTKEAYQKVDNAIILERPTTKEICAALEEQNIESIAKKIKNVFEEAMPIAAVKSIVAQMRQQAAIGACMSGSGSAVFGIFPSKHQAEQCATLLMEQYHTFTCQPTTQGVYILEK